MNNASSKASSAAPHRCLPLVPHASGVAILSAFAVVLVTSAAELSGVLQPTLQPYLELGTILATALITGSLLSNAFATHRATPRLRAAILALLAASLLAVFGLLAPLILDHPAGPTLSLIAQLTAMFSAAIGALLVPARKLPRTDWLALGFDIATLTLTALLGFWFFSLHPGHFIDAPVWPNQVLAATTVLTTILLCAGLLTLISRHTNALRHGAAVYLAAGAALLLVIDIFPLVFSLSKGGVTPPPHPLGWTLFMLAAAVMGSSTRLPPPEKPRLSSESMAGIPYAATTLIGLLLITSIFVRDALSENITILLPALFTALALVVGRQTLVASDRARMVRELTAARDLAERANASRLHFLANISHDLRTPLNGILGCAQIMLRNPNVTRQQTELLKTVVGCADQLQNLINDLLDMSKLEAGRLELVPAPFDLREFLFELTKTFTLQAEAKNIQLDLETSDSLPDWIICDRKRLFQILGNLISNAIKFTDRGSVSLTVTQSSGRLHFAVTDTGCGIDPGRIKDLFKPFQALDEKSLKLEGTGLGLSISHQLARMMGGEVSVESEVGLGSTFQVTIPLERADPAPETNRTVVDYKGPRRHVLIVDDNPANRVVIRSILEGAGFIVAEAASGTEALAHLQSHRADIAVLDLMMPGMDGFELCRRIRDTITRQPPVCFALSAMAGDDIDEQCRNAGFARLLHKPLVLDDLVEAFAACAGIEWISGAFKPDPRPAAISLRAKEPQKFPPPDQLSQLIDFARRGNVRNIEALLSEILETDPACQAFVEKARRFLTEFRMKELARWLESQTTDQAALQPSLSHVR